MNRRDFIGTFLAALCGVIFGRHADLVVPEISDDGIEALDKLMTFDQFIAAWNKNLEEIQKMMYEGDYLK